LLSVAAACLIAWQQRAWLSLLGGPAVRWSRLHGLVHGLCNGCKPCTLPLSLTKRSNKLC
jgi:hypothetical protein